MTSIPGSYISFLCRHGSLKRLKTIFLKGGYLWPPITPPQSLPLSNGHHGWNEPHASSLRQGLSNTELDDATSLAAVQTKRYRNSVCAVSKLPPELLSYVFSINIYCDRPGAKNGTSHLGWISVTQVCHYWREVRKCKLLTTELDDDDDDDDDDSPGRARNSIALEIPGLYIHVSKVVF